MDQKIIDLWDGLTHGYMSRREFIDRAAAIVGSTAAATALIPLLQCDYAKAAIIDPNDARLSNEKVAFDSPAGKITGYLSRPRRGGKRPAIVVIHQNRGLNPHIEDVARRYATEGFLALAPDFLAPLGGTPAKEEEAIALYSKVDRSNPAVGLAAIAWLKNRADSSGKVGIIGFCGGGDQANLLATHAQDIDAAVVYYGLSPDASRAKNVRAPLLLHYAGLDKRVNATVPAWEEALKANNKRYTLHMYEGVNHAFSDDTNAARYDKAAAELAWDRTLAFFKETLGTPPSAS